MKPQAEGQTLQSLSGHWRQEFAHVMEAMADVRPEMQERTEPAAGTGPNLWWRQQLDAAPGATVWVGTSEETWIALGTRILTAAGIDSPSADEVQSSYLEVLRQSLSAFASGIGSELEREITCTDGALEPPPAGDMPACGIRVHMDGVTLPGMTFQASLELIELMSRQQPAAQGQQPAAEADNAAADAQDDAASNRVYNTLDLLLDVEMPVSVSFGRTQLRIQEILKLITGSIIELDRSIAEPVEVIVNNCVVARGEVVVVEGNYGVRINEVMSRHQRLQESRRYLLPVSHRH